MGRPPAQVLLRWCVQRDLPVIPKSTHRDRIEENAKIFDFSLSDVDVAALDALELAPSAGCGNAAKGPKMPELDHMGSAYDTVIVGAGGAGAALAAGLSEDPDRQVLLVEAGPDHPTTESFPPDLLDAGLATGNLPGHPNNWAFVANLTPELSYSVARGKVLGGSTALNGTYFIRARKADLDRWAAAGNTEWGIRASASFQQEGGSRISYDW